MIIDLTYSYDAYFSDKLDPYLSDETANKVHTLSIETLDEITPPNKDITFTYKNRYKMVSEEETYIVTHFNQGKGIKHMIYHTNDYQTIKIYLNKKLGQRLAEYEYVLSGMAFFEMALVSGYLPVHASCIHYKNHTFLLSGPSKSGKSTQTNYFMQAYPASIIINEDKPLVYFKDHKAFVVGSPWSGKHVINANMERPLDYMFFIEKAKDLKIKELSKNKKIQEVFRNIHRPGDEVLVDQMMTIVDHMIHDLDIYAFACIHHIQSAYYLNKFMEENL